MVMLAYLLNKNGYYTDPRIYDEEEIETISIIFEKRFWRWNKYKLAKH
jgi:hypothetical protein